MYTFDNLIVGRFVTVKVNIKNYQRIIPDAKIIYNNKLQSKLMIGWLEDDKSFSADVCLHEVISCIEVDEEFAEEIKNVLISI